MNIGELRQAGFSDLEIGNHIDKKKKEYLAAGFSASEIDNHFGMSPDPVDDEWKAKLDEIAENAINSYFQERIQEAAPKPLGNVETDRLIKSEKAKMPVKEVKGNLETKRDQPAFRQATDDRNIIDRIIDEMTLAPLIERMGGSIYDSGFFKRPSVRVTPTEAVKLGWQFSTLRLSQKAPDPYIKRLQDLIDLNADDPNAIGFGTRQLLGAVQFMSDLPAHAIGAGIGAGVGAAMGPEAVGPGAMGGFFAFPKALRRALMDKYEKGDVKDANELIKRSTVYLGELVKGAAVGVTTRGVGGAALKVSGGNIVARLGAEIPTMVIAESILEGEVPTNQQFIDTAAALGIFHIAGVGTKSIKNKLISTKLRNIYAETGIKPESVFADVKKNPMIAKQVLEPNAEVPEVYRKKPTEMTIDALRAEADTPIDITKAPMVEYKGQQILDYENLSGMQKGKKASEFAAEFGKKMNPEQAGALADSYKESVSEFIGKRPELSPQERLQFNLRNTLKNETLEAFERESLNKILKIRYQADGPGIKTIRVGKDLPGNSERAVAETVITEAMLRTRSSRQWAEIQYEKVKQEWLDQQGEKTVIDRPEKVADEVLPLLEQLNDPNITPEKSVKIRQQVDDIYKAKGEKTNSGLEDVNEKVPENIRIKRAQAGAINLSARKPKSGFKYSDPKAEEAYQRMSKGLQKDPFLQRTYEALKSLRNKLTREFEHLPRTAKFAPARYEVFLPFLKQKNIALDNALGLIRKITDILDPEAMDLFQRKVTLEDFNEMITREEILPKDFTKETVVSELSRVDDAIYNSKNKRAIEAAIESRKIIYDDIIGKQIDAFKKLGIDVSEKFTRKAYFRHMVTEYIRFNGLYGTGTRLKKQPTGGYLKQRQGSELDINLNYIQAETEVLSQMLYNTARAELYHKLDRHYNIVDKVKSEAKKRGVENWEDILNEYEGYSAYNIKSDSSFYFTESISSSIAERLLTDQLKEVGITANDLRKVLAVGSKETLVLPDEIIATLEEFNKTMPNNPILDGVSKIHNWWKWEKAGGNPKRYMRWHLRNLIGDATFSWLGDARILKEAPSSTSELWSVFAGKKQMDGRLKDFHDLGAFETTQQIHEMHELNDMKIFMHTKHPGIELSEIPATTWNEWLQFTKSSNQFREAIMRYSGYKEYLRQIESNPEGRPDNFGASIPEEIMAIQDPKVRAFTLSNQLHGAYDQVGVLGQSASKYFIMFYKYRETSVRRYFRLAANAFSNNELTTKAGENYLKKVGLFSSKVTPVISMKVGKLLIKAGAFWGLSTVFNNYFFPDEEQDLPEDIKNSMHLTFGRDDKGNVQYFNRLDPLGDFLSLFGIDMFPKYINQMMDGKASFKDVAQNIINEPINEVIQGMEPVSKITYELLTQRALFPNAFKPRLIRNKVLHTMNAIGLQAEYGAFYKAVTGYPITEPYLNRLGKDLLLYKIDPYESAYNDIKTLEYQFKKRKGLDSNSFYSSLAGNAVYYARMAQRYGDKKGVEKWVQEYMKFGGKLDGFYNSIERLLPLENLDGALKAEFISSLNKEDMNKLMKAFKFWEELATGIDISAQEVKQ